MSAIARKYRETTAPVVIGNTELLTTVIITDDETEVIECWLRTPETGGYGYPINIGTLDALFVKDGRSVYAYLLDEIAPRAAE